MCRKSVAVSSQDGRLKPTAPYLGFSRRKAVKISSTVEEVSAAVSVWDASVSSFLPPHSRSQWRLGRGGPGPSGAARPHPWS